jgi:hypothetical protein
MKRLYKFVTPLTLSKTMQELRGCFTALLITYLTDDMQKKCRTKLQLYKRILLHCYRAQLDADELNQLMRL